MTLNDIITAETNRDTFPAAMAFCGYLRDTYGKSVAAVIFYGSCLRANTDEGLLLDFYVLVDKYGPALNSVWATWGARLLPPNVYYHETTFEGRFVRAKVAVIAVNQFLHGVGPESFASSLWARFAQPAAILYARNNEVGHRIVRGLSEAVSTMIARARPLMEQPFTARELWVRAFAETYRAELRPERDNKGAELVEAEIARYSAVTAAVLGVPEDGTYQASPIAAQHKAERAWWLRRIQGKTLNALRLIKAAFTFTGGLDYAVWKIERHSGVKIELTEAQRKRPLITGVKLFLGTVKKDGLR
jgi:hypothetical protein